MSQPPTNKKKKKLNTAATPTNVAPGWKNATIPTTIRMALRAACSTAQPRLEAAASMSSITPAPMAMQPKSTATARTEVKSNRNTIADTTIHAMPLAR